MIRLLHISDLHINAGYANKDAAIRKKLKSSMFESLEAMVSFTLEQKLDAVLIAGDFFDHDKTTFQDEVEISRILNRLLDASCHIIYTSGNHDPMHTAPFLNALAVHEHFHLIDDDQVKLLSLNTTGGKRFKVVGVGHKSKNEQRSLISKFPVKSDQDIWVGIAHASVPSAITTPDKQLYMATPLSVIEALNYDYFALGHIHIRQKLSSRVAYSGNIQGINIKETGGKGGYLVELDKDYINVEAVDFNKVEWVMLQCELTPDTMTLSELQTILSSKLSDRISNIGLPARNIMARIILSGKTKLKDALSVSSNIEYLCEMLKNGIGLLALEIKTDQLSMPIEIEMIKNENTVLSQMIERIESGRYETELLEQIYGLPIFGPKTSNEEKKVYLNAIKDLMIEEIIERMVIDNED